MEKIRFRIIINSPAVLGFTALCFVSLVLGFITNGASTMLLFSVYNSSLLDPLTYLRFFGHVCGHAGWEHFIGNIMLILVIGPLLEEKYGTSNIIFTILATAFITGLIHFIFFPGALLGASGVVFAFILLSSFVGLKEEGIPLTFILVALIYIGEQVYQGLFVQDSVSQFTHIIGGIVGSGIGIALNKNKLGLPQ